MQYYSSGFYIGEENGVYMVRQDLCEVGIDTLGPTLNDAIEEIVRYKTKYTGLVSVKSAVLGNKLVAVEFDELITDYDYESSFKIQGIRKATLAEVDAYLLYISTNIEKDKQFKRDQITRLKKELGEV